MRAVNVLEVAYDLGSLPEVSIRSFPDTDKGFRQAEEFFMAILVDDMGISQSEADAAKMSGFMYAGTRRLVCIVDSV